MGSGALGELSVLIRGRRSVKPEMLDSGRPVSGELVDELLENATWAPNHGRTEPWWFVVFEGAARSELAAFLQRVYCETTPEAEIRPEKLAKLATNPLRAPVVVAFGLRRGNNPKIPEVEEIEAVACAVQNVLLSASAAGLGGFWSSPAVCYAEVVREFFGLGPDDRCLGLLYLGWPKEGVEVPAPERAPLAASVRRWAPAAGGAGS